LVFHAKNYITNRVAASKFRILTAPHGREVSGKISLMTVGAALITTFI